MEQTLMLIDHEKTLGQSMSHRKRNIVKHDM